MDAGLHIRCKQRVSERKKDMQNILIEKLIAEHRAKAFITCDENCFCWVIERVLTVGGSETSEPVEDDRPKAICECKITHTPDEVVDNYCYLCQRPLFS